jgi:hypothetical protein
LLAFIPLVTAILYANRNAHSVFVLMGIALSATIALAKFSIFPLAIGAFALVDLLSILRRELPYKTGAFLAASAILFTASGQNLADFPAYLTASLEVSFGYSAAMSTNGSRLESSLGWCSRSYLSLWSYGANGVA